MNVYSDSIRMGDSAAYSQGWCILRATARPYIGAPRWCCLVSKRHHAARVAIRDYSQTTFVQSPFTGRLRHSACRLMLTAITAHSASRKESKHC